MFKPSKEIKDLCALEDNFCWYGDNDIPDKDRWGPTISQNRDSGPLEVSNFETISQDMLERFPDDTRIVHSTHWGFGWVEQLFVRHYDVNGPTPAHEAIMEWNDKLGEYPVADEGDFCHREYVSQIEDITWRQSVSENDAKLIHKWLSDNGIYIETGDGYWPSDDEFNRAKSDLGLDIED